MQGTSRRKKALALTHAIGEESLLKRLRQKKKLSRSELSRRTQLSTYQVEGLEGAGTKKFLRRILMYVQALGYKAEEVIHLMASDCLQKEEALVSGTLGKAKEETTFNAGVKLLIYAEKGGCILCQLDMKSNNAWPRESLPPANLVFGIVREGTLVIHMLAKQAVYKKDHFFVFPGNLPVELQNNDPYAPVLALLFFVKYPQ